MASYKQITSRASYVDSLELATTSVVGFEREATPLVLRDLRSDEASGYVAAGSTVSFVGGVPQVRQGDVLNSTLLAQLAANKKYDREVDTEEWYRFYRSVLENLGWVVPNFSFARFNSGSATLEMDKGALAIISALASGNSIAALEAALLALEKQDPDSSTVRLFESNSSDAEAGNFQLGTCSVDSNDNLTMSLGTFYYKASRRQGGFLFFKWSSSDVNFYASGQNIVLNDAVYSTIRQSVIDKLGDAASRFVADLEI